MLGTVNINLSSFFELSKCIAYYLEWQNFVELINRLGIILNFFAGFMLAPELVGIDRLNNLERRFERLIKRFLIFNRRIWRSLKKLINPNNDSMSNIVMLRVFIAVATYSLFLIVTNLDKSIVKLLILPVLAFGFIVVVAFFIILLVSIALGGILLLFLAEMIVELDSQVSRSRGYGAIVEDVKSIRIKSIRSFQGRLFDSIKPRNIAESVKSIFEDLFKGWIKELGRITLSILLVLPIVLLLLITIPLRKVLLKLKGDSRLISILNSWGLSFFIIGNIFQFLATF
jgi:hypothetical protein